MSFREDSKSPEPTKKRVFYELLLGALDLFGTYVMVGRKVPHTEVQGLRKQIWGSFDFNRKSDRKQWSNFRSHVGSMGLDGGLVIDDKDGAETVMWLLFQKKAVVLFKVIRRLIVATDASIPNYNVQGYFELIKHVGRWLQLHPRATDVEEDLRDLVGSILEFSNKKNASRTAEDIYGAILQPMWDSESVREEMGNIFLEPSFPGLRLIDEMEEHWSAIDEAWRDIKSVDTQDKNRLIRDQLDLANSIITNRKLLTECRHAVARHRRTA